MPLLTGLLACNLTAHYTHGTLKVYLFSIKNLIHCLLLAKNSSTCLKLILLANCLTIWLLNCLIPLIVMLAKNKQYEEIA